MITNGMELQYMLTEIKFDKEELQTDLNEDGIESLVQLDMSNYTYPYTYFEIRTFDLGNRHLVEYEINYINDEKYDITFTLHPLVDTPQGTTLYTLFQLKNSSSDTVDAPHDTLLLRYEPTLLLSYAYYSGHPQHDAELLSALVISSPHTNTSYWLDDTQEHVCIQISDGYLLGTVEEEDCLIFRLQTFMPLNRIMLPPSMWPPETTPYADLIAAVTDNKKPKPSRILEHTTDEHHIALETEILDFIAPFEDLRSRSLTRDWKRFWHDMLAIPEVWQYIARPVRQAGTNYNRNHIAHILNLMKEQKLLTDTSGTELMKLQPLTNDSFRIHFGKNPQNNDLRNILRGYFEKTRKHTRLR